jgi:high-affinity K+ transport system ATPase subunit B
MYYFRSMSTDLIVMAIVLVLLLVFLAVKAAVFVVMTFLKYYKHSSLWIALAVCLLLCLVGVLLGHFVHVGFFSLAYVGVAVLLITCKVVDMRNSDTLMIEKPGLINQVLHQSWWATDDTPLELEDELLVA